MTENKDNRLTILIEPSVELMARKCADSQGETLSSFVRAAIRDYIDKCNRQETVYALPRSGDISERANEHANVLNHEDLKILRAISKLAKVYGQ